METAEINSLNRSDFEWFRKLIEKNAGVYVLDAKVPFLTNRVLKRMKALGVGTFEKYINLLKRDRVEGKELINLLEEVVISDTWFFRNTKQFQVLSDVIFPVLVNEKVNKDRKVIINVLGCSSGQEPYSIAILVNENIEPEKRHLFRINAVDISERLLRRAREGYYKQHEMKGLNNRILEKYFTPEGSGYRLDRDISGMVNFFQFNLKDENWKKFRFSDLISCRNTMIYFRERTRKIIMKRLVNSVRPGGFVLLGHSEIVNGNEYGDISNIAHNIYRKARG